MIKKKISLGFSLIEMAVVLAIVALLLGGLLPMISGQMEQQHRVETRKQLDEIRSSLIGFSVANGRLPCPDTDNDGNENFLTPAAAVVVNNAPYTGQSTKINSPCNGGGTLPYNQLGVSPKDDFDNAFIYNVTPIFSGKNIERWSNLNGTGSVVTTDINGKFLLTDTGTLRVCASTTNAATTPCPTPRLIDTAAAVVVSRGPNWAQTPSVEESENNDHDSDFIFHDFSPSFDDLVIWLSPNTLFNRLVAAGKLP